MIEINLIPNVKLELIKAQKIRSTVTAFSVLIGIVAVGVVGLMASYVYIAQAVRSNLADTNIKTENSKLASVEDLSKTVTIQNQLATITALNDNKLVSSRLFDVITAIIPPSPNDVKISSISIDSTKRVVSISGQASNGYSALETFKKTVERANIKYTDSNNKEIKTLLASNISMSNVSYGADTSGAKVLRFDLQFNYVAELFSVKSGNLTIVISDGGNVTDSYLGVPMSIFTTRAADLTGDN